MEQKIVYKVTKRVKRYREEQAAIRCCARGDIEARQFLIGRLVKGQEPAQGKGRIPESVWAEIERLR